MSCWDCNGTGIYVGKGERDGAGVVCRSCGGKREVDDMNARGIKWVYLHNPSILIETNHVLGVGLPDFGGMSYSDWMNGRLFVVGMEMRNCVCPRWFYQRYNDMLVPKWGECCSDSSGACSLFDCKDTCWERWDNEIGSCLEGGVIEKGKCVILRHGLMRPIMHKRSEEEQDPII